MIKSQQLRNVFANKQFFLSFAWRFSSKIFRPQIESWAHQKKNLWDQIRTSIFPLGEGTPSIRNHFQRQQLWKLRFISQARKRNTSFLRRRKKSGMGERERKLVYRKKKVRRRPEFPQKHSEEVIDWNRRKSFYLAPYKWVAPFITFIF